MDLDKIITEVYDTANKSYPAYNAPARKDFVPQSSTNTPNFPYQKQDDLTNPPPESVPSYPWPMQTVVDDLSDSFVYLSIGLDKISTCVKNNPALKDHQKEELISLYKKARKALRIIRHVGLTIGKATNMTGAQPSQNPVSAPEHKGAETDPLKNTVKIRVR